MARVKRQFTVLGSTGFIGNRLVSTLRSYGENLLVPAKQSDEIFERPLGIVYYCVGLTADYSKRPFDTVEAHVSYLARILKESNFEHLVYLSSTRLYDGLNIDFADGETSLCLSPNSPRHLYDLSKALGENICRTVERERTSIARLSCVYDCAPNSPGFLSEILQRLRYERSITVESSPFYQRDYISLDDAIRSLIAIGRHQKSGIFNVASGDNTINQEISDALSGLGVDIKFSGDGKPSHLPRCNIENLRELGITPSNTIDTLQAIVGSFST